MQTGLAGFPGRHQAKGVPALSLHLQVQAIIIIGVREVYLHFVTLDSLKIVQHLHTIDPLQSLPLLNILSMKLLNELGSAESFIVLVSFHSRWIFRN